MLTFLLCATSALLGVWVGATWPEIKFWVRPGWTWRWERAVKPNMQILLGWALVAVMVVGAVTGIGLIVTRATVAGNDRENREYQACTSEYQQDFAEAYKARANASIKTTRALDRVVRAVAQSDADSFRAAVAHYLEVRKQQRIERAANPLPAFPEKVCGPAPED